MRYLKILFLSLIGVLLLSLTSCSGCKSAKVEPVVGNVTATQTVSALGNVDHIIAMDRQAMFLKFGDQYRWYETDILLPEFLDSENVTSTPVMLVNVFQSIIEYDNGADTYVWKFQHFPDGTVNVDSVHGFWIENWPLNDEVLKVNYAQAWDKMMAVNYPKPHSRHVTLRNPIGPVSVNTQWIFGNIRAQIWIDAVTGNATNSNPAFPEEKGFKMPLGEWP